MAKRVIIRMNNVDRKSDKEIFKIFTTSLLTLKG